MSLKVWKNISAYHKEKKIHDLQHSRKSVVQESKEFKQNSTNDNFLEIFSLEFL